MTLKQIHDKIWEARSQANNLFYTYTRGTRLVDGPHANSPLRSIYIISWRVNNLLHDRYKSKAVTRWIILDLRVSWWPGAMAAASRRSMWDCSGWRSASLSGMIWYEARSERDLSHDHRYIYYKWSAPQGYEIFTWVKDSKQDKGHEYRKIWPCGLKHI